MTKSKRKVANSFCKIRQRRGRCGTSQRTGGRHLLVRSEGLASFVAQGFEWIDLACAADGNPAGEQPHGHEKDSN